MGEEPGGGELAAHIVAAPQGNGAAYNTTSSRWRTSVDAGAQQSWPDEGGLGDCLKAAPPIFMPASHARPAKAITIAGLSEEVSMSCRHDVSKETSVDYRPAFDIAGEGKVQPTRLIAAIEYATGPSQ